MLLVRHELYASKKWSATWVRQLAVSDKAGDRVCCLCGMNCTLQKSGARLGCGSLPPKKPSGKTERLND